MIEDYPKDTPYPSCLVLGIIEGRPLHVVVAVDKDLNLVIVVTVYEPDLQQWDPGFERRRIR